MASANKSASSKIETPSRKLNIVCIHGDPTLPNDILPGGKWDEDDYEAVDKAKQALSNLSDRYNFEYLCSHETLMTDLMERQRAGKIDLVLQLCDEGWMNNSRMEMHVTAFLEMLSIPFTGSGPKTIAITYDKQAVLKIAESIGIPVPKSVYIEGKDIDDADPEQLGLIYPIIVKPNSTDGSFGITAMNVCNNLEQVKAAITQIRSVFHITCPLLFQEYLTGRDINVGLMERADSRGDQEVWVLPITEEDYSALPEHLPKICGFESKWDEASPYYKIVTRPTTLPINMQQRISQWSRDLFKRIECHDYARFDFRLDSHGNPRLLEANPNCGWCWDGHLPKTAQLCGVEYSQFFDMIIQSALRRHQTRLIEQSRAKKFVHVGKQQKSEEAVNSAER